MFVKLASSEAVEQRLKLKLLLNTFLLQFARALTVITTDPYSCKRDSGLVGAVSVPKFKPYIIISSLRKL